MVQFNSEHGFLVCPFEPRSKPRPSHFDPPMCRGSFIPNQISNDANGTKRTFAVLQQFVRFSNRPFGVKHFQTIHHCSVDVAHGLVLLFGIGTKALPLWDSRTRRNNLLRGLAVRLTIGPSGHANSSHPSSREGHHSTARWSSGFLLSHLIL